MHAITDLTSSTRRHFLAAGSAASLAAPAILRAATRSDKLRIGLIGCGGRGTGAAAQALTADSNVELYAMGDVFPTQIANSQESLKKQFEKDPTRINVPVARQFTGLDAYQKVLQSGVDVVLLCTPGGFRPFHLRAAIEAGKHVFCEKPMAVDPAGIRSVLESTRLAKEKNLAIRAGFNFRFESPYRAAMQRVQDGAIGDIVAIYSTRMSNRLARFDGVRQPGQTDLEYQLRNWHHFVWLSGDLILEVTAHSIDKVAWAMRDVPPVKCHASGARHQATVGDCFDQWDVTYEWENGVIGVLKTRYQNGCHNEHRDVLIGTKGKCELGWGSAKITGATNWRYEGEKPVSHQVEHDEFFADLRAGKTPNDGQRMAQSTMMGIMGRMSAYTGKEVSWDFAMKSKLATMPEKLTWDMKLPEPKAAEPGKTPLV
jgi:predicted dehydrogenase